MNARFTPFQAASYPAEPAGLPVGWWRRLGLMLVAFGLLRMGLVLVSQASLHVDEAQYWDWSRSLQWGYYSKPPVVAVLIRASTTLFGDSELGLRLLAIWCWPLTAGVLAVLGVSLARAGGATPGQAGRVGTLTALVWLCSVLAALLGQVVTTDTPLLLCWALALWALWQAVALRRQGGWALLALALGVGLLDKYTIAAWLPGALLWVLWQGRPRDLLGLAAAAAGALLLLSPNLLWNAAQGWPTLRHTADITVRAVARGNEAELPLRVLEYALGQVISFGPLILVGAAVWALGAVWARRRNRTVPTACPALPRAARTLLWCTSLPLLGAGLLQAAHGHAELNWVAPVHLALALGLAHALVRGGRERAARALVLVQLVLLTLLSAAPAWVAPSQPGLAAAIDPWRRQRGWDEALARLAPALRAQPGGVLVSDSRAALTQLAYHLRGQGVQRMAWAPGPVADNHYELTCPWHPGSHAPGPVWVLTEGAPSPELASALGGLEPVAQAPVLRLGREFSRLYLSRAPQAQDSTASPPKTCP